MKKVCLLILLITFCLKISFAQQGKDGAEVISANTVVNDYTTLTNNTTAGSNSIIVGSNTAFSAGDLLLIIQMQGAVINGTVTDSTWGAITNYDSCGLNELVEVAGVVDAQTIDLKCPLRNGYLASGNTQVVRVPRYTSLTINAGDTLLCDAWNGSTGGIVAVEVSGNTIINGAINATAMGFRGGALINLPSGPDTSTIYASTNPGGTAYGAPKGEGIAGYQGGYNIYGGQYGRGAPANGGGGGNVWNSAGGGGANAGNSNEWTGNGNPDTTTSANYITAWNLEYPGFATSTSSGGGRGGYATAASENNPYVYGPNNPIWSSLFMRENVGGKGGRPLDYSTGRLFLGGGGGAGHEDDNNALGGGGNGGGLIYIVSYGTVSGSGSVLSNGQNGYEDNSTGSGPGGTTDGDGPGGAGGGGTIVINSIGTISGVSVYANGGAGGDQDILNTTESQGAGGGGGGGYVVTSNGGITTEVLGGVNGITNSIGVAPFLPNGATKGGNGIATIAVTCIPHISVISGATLVCAGSSNKYSIPEGCPNTTYTWTLPSGWKGKSATDTITATAGTTSGIIKVSTSNGNGCPLDTIIMVTVYPTPANPGFPKDTLVCSPVNFTLDANSTGFNYLWSTGDTTASITVTKTGLYWLNVYGACDTVRDSINVIQKNKPTVFIGNDTSYCGSFSRVLNAGDSAVTYLWSTGAATQIITVNTEGTYWVTVSNTCGQTTDTIKITGCEAGYILPSAFTPSGENANNLLGLLKTGEGTTTLQYFRIYNRWGQVVFFTTDDQAKWDGKFNGQPQPLGTYVYVVSYLDMSGDDKLLKGNVTLIR